MKLASFSLASLLFLAACHSREARMIDELSAPEKAAFLAAERYRSCTQVFVQKAKAEHQKLSDDDLRRSDIDAHQNCRVLPRLLMLIG